MIYVAAGVIKSKVISVFYVLHVVLLFCHSSWKEQPYHARFLLPARRRPRVFFHECTRLFKPAILQNYLEEYAVHFAVQKPTSRGFPIKRTRMYSACIRRCGWEIQVHCLIKWGVIETFGVTHVHTGQSVEILFRHGPITTWSIRHGRRFPRSKPWGNERL